MTLGSEARRLGLIESASQDERRSRSCAAWASTSTPACPRRTPEHRPAAPARRGEDAAAPPPDPDHGRADGHPHAVGRRAPVRDHPRPRRRGGSVIYISHRLEEIFAIADRVTVLRDGQLVGTLPVAESGIDQNGLIAMMVGREIDSIFPDRGTAGATGAPSLVVRGLLAKHPPTRRRPGGPCRRDPRHRGAHRLRPHRARRGPVRTNPSLTSRSRSTGVPCRSTTPADAIARRHRSGTRGPPPAGPGRRDHRRREPHADRAAPYLVTRVGLATAPAELAQSLIDRLEIRTFGPGQVVATLSGGNQQKVVIAKWLARTRASSSSTSPPRASTWARAARSTGRSLTSQTAGAS